MNIEFSGGGPADGQLREIQGTPETLLLFELAPGKLSETQPEAHVPKITHVYRAAHRIGRDGAHVFMYGGRVR